MTTTNKKTTTKKPAAKEKVVKMPAPKPEEPDVQGDAALQLIETSIQEVQRVVDDFNKLKLPPIQDVEAMKEYKKKLDKFQSKFMEANFLTPHWLKLTTFALRECCGHNRVMVASYIRSAGRQVKVDPTLKEFAEKAAEAAQEADAKAELEGKSKKPTQKTIFDGLTEKGVDTALALNL